MTLPVSADLVHVRARAEGPAQIWGGLLQPCWAASLASKQSAGTNKLCCRTCTCHRASTWHMVASQLSWCAMLEVISTGGTLQLGLRTPTPPTVPVRGWNKMLLPSHGLLGWLAASTATLGQLCCVLLLRLVPGAAGRQATEPPSSGSSEGGWWSALGSLPTHKLVQGSVVAAGVAVVNSDDLR